LPPGKGTHAEGAIVWAAKCARCHGATGREGPHGRLVGRMPPRGFKLGRPGPQGATVTVGNYWPFATTLFDYVRRAMPPEAPGTLSADQVYGLVAWLLHENDIIAADAVMDAKTLPAVVMPARDRLVEDPDRGRAR
jgi:cytochrome c